MTTTNKITIQELIDSLQEFTSKELTQVITAATEARGSLVQHTWLSIGDQVWFEKSQVYHGIITGTLIKVKGEYAIIRSLGGVYEVSLDQVELIPSHTRETIEASV